MHLQPIMSAMRPKRRELFALHALFLNNLNASSGEQAVTVFKLAMIAALTAFGLCACESESKLPVSAGEGRNPELPPPTDSVIPTVNIAIAKGWPAGEKPKPAAGMRVEALADKLDHPRWLYVLPNGDVLVAETNGPERPRELGRHQRLASPTGYELGWRRDQERGPHHALSWTRRERRSARARSFSGRVALPVRHGACGRYDLRRQQQCRDEVSL